MRRNGPLPGERQGRLLSQGVLVRGPAKGRLRRCQPTRSSRGETPHALPMRGAGRQHRGPCPPGHPRQAEAGLVGGQAASTLRLQDRELPVFPAGRRPQGTCRHHLRRRKGRGRRSVRAARPPRHRHRDRRGDGTNAPRIGLGAVRHRTGDPVARRRRPGPGAHAPGGAAAAAWP